MQDGGEKVVEEEGMREKEASFLRVGNSREKERAMKGNAGKRVALENQMLVI